ncbi:TauD/TfdA family dioxygenase [Streptomyces antarcticus]|uniref:TauD/TfdA family dioxygenase n=1 Tax=Streptomyces antarcticus TaxID=2996458 RepID=UPI00226FF592|nr:MULTISPECIES: TauD/TfdA family dioxygenase [unclassified Streptomyces]MCY0941349.1 TauD/TfdA family dioxygenase [Streptomyces sp. H34-AA3]MCZ4084775.1 TauD/TfdA family dioxygenase [Streptomyces sp. H34-S5]
MTLSAIVEAAGGEDIVEHLAEHRTELRARLLEHGAVLLRGFGTGGAAGLEQVVSAFTGGAPLEYAERSSPRSTITGRVYTSTDYPPDEEIFLHNENSYQASWPRVLFFQCVEPAHTLGATPLADTRRIHRALDPRIREEFRARGWRVVRNFHPDLGIRWQDTFGTEDRDAVEEYCRRRRGIAVEWRPYGGLRTTVVRSAVRVHPKTGEEVWFNHATFFHVTTLGEEIRQGLREMFPEEDLPTHTYYGDGGRIPDEVMAELRAAYRAESTRFDWRRDDVLMVDDMLAAHGREPFTGPRRIAVAMADPYDAG